MIASYIYLQLPNGRKDRSSQKKKIPKQKLTDGNIKRKNATGTRRKGKFNNCFEFFIYMSVRSFPFDISRRDSE